MKKKIILIAACLTLIALPAWAAPLTDYSRGKLSIDLNFRHSQNTVSDSAGVWNYPKKYNFEPSITVGLGNKWAFQYRGVNAKSDTQHSHTGEWGNSKVTVSEFNALYQLGPNVSGFAGFVSAKGALAGWEGQWYDDWSRRNTWQLGLVGSAPLADKFTVYSVVGVGNKWNNYEIGLSYAITKNLEFNVDYRYIKVKGLECQHHVYRFESKTKGWGFGLTCKL